MPNKIIRLRHARRKRTIASLLFGGLIIVGLVVSSFYFTLRQERSLTVLDPADDTTVDTEDDSMVELQDTTDIFEPARELSIDEKERNDQQRRSDIAAIHSALQAYYQQHGDYPKLTQLNSDQFREANFPDVPEEIFQDPADEGSRIVITRTAQPATYAYDVVDEDGFTCEPSRRACVSYSLSALLSGGLAFTLDSDE